MVLKVPNVSKRENAYVPRLKATWEYEVNFRQATWHLKQLNDETLYLIAFMVF